MKNKLIILIFANLIAIFPFLKNNTLLAQTEENLKPEFGMELSAGFDKKIIKGLHLTVEEEMRLDNNFKSFDRLQTTVGLSYKVHKNIKLGLAYRMINPYKTSSKSFKFQHRLMFDVTGTLHLGKWNLSLKEQFQWTYHAGSSYNVYQYPRNALTLKSRLMIRYKGHHIAEPYAYVELRNIFNAPSVTANYDGTSYLTEDGYSTDMPGWFINRYGNAYINRVRGSIGVNVKVHEHHSLKFYILGDYVHDKVIDANSEGTKLKSYNIEKGFVGKFGIGYTISY
ncbi:MAG: DUF2490 domain-containing protein [Bacteroidales bacterium]|nr:DUF2490 domain-containing protein [Bacteroidales bacterium]MBQ7490691.1 DUF2490 domain-containing protein [Bacteroidales bacterium]